jgi:hypothetical protein
MVETHENESIIVQSTTLMQMNTFGILNKIEE